MGHKFAEIAFTDSVQIIQQQMGSRANYQVMESGEDHHYLLGQNEAGFLALRDSFYMASVSETGWPYVQHRGGPIGFMKMLDAKTIGFADYSGNRQYVSVGNFSQDNRVSLFFMDYPNKTRLKLLGRVEIIGHEQPELLAKLEVDDYRAQVERGIIIHIEAFDWNCPQHITPRYTDEDVADLMAPIRAESEALKASVRDSLQLPKPQVLGDGPLPLVISGIRQLTPRIRAFELRDPKGGRLPKVEAGAHIQLPVRLDNGEITSRYYSICSDPKDQSFYQIAVLKEQDGSGGSVAVHQQFDLGLQLNCPFPQNNFQLHSDQRPTVLIAGGIGITPIKVMAQTLKDSGRKLQLHYAGRTRQEMAFVDKLEHQLVDEMTSYSSAEGQRLDIEQLMSSASQDTEFYVCGPGRLIDAVISTGKSLNIVPERIHFERFGASVALGDKPIHLELSRSAITLEVRADQSILDAMLDAGINAPYSCKAGNCKSCATKVLSGEIEHRDSVLTSVEKQEMQLMCPCVSRTETDHLVLDI
jgi:ferredoxin-NADP reductase/predicted pyridoxine 5'-phosphate oxidase superfamily flavin-nucleotide-binding protein